MSILFPPQSPLSSVAVPYKSAARPFARSAADRTTDRVNVKDFGAVGDGAIHLLSDTYSTLAAAQADFPSATALTQDKDTLGLQAAIDSLGASGGTVYAPLGSYLLRQITLRDRVIVEGDSITTTEFRLQPSANTDFFVSAGFASLTGQNKFTTSDGVPGWLGFRQCRINGNKAAQSMAGGVGSGLVAYARGLILDQVIVHACSYNGIYSECGVGPTINDWYDLCEGSAGPLWLWNNGNHGWHFRGPHDQRISHVISALNGGGGLRIESSYTYTGSCDIGFAHIYANTGIGFYCDATQQCRAQQIVSESNFQEGLYLDCSICQFNNVQAYNNCLTSGVADLYLTSASIGNIIPNAAVTSVKLGGTGLSLNGQRNVVTAVIDGYNGAALGTGIGVDIVGGSKGNIVKLVIQNFGGVGGIGLQVNNGGTSQYNNVEAQIIGCTTMFNNAGFGNDNRYLLRGYFDITASPAQQMISGAGAPNNNPGQTEIFDLVFRRNDGTDFRSRTRLQNSTSVDLTSTAEQTFTFTHQLVYTPLPESTQADIYYAGTDTAWAVQYVRVSAITATTVTVKVKLSTAAATGQTATLCLTSEL